MADVFSPAKRSAIMSRIRSRGNASTELRVVRALRRAGVTGWRRHPENVLGSPDFLFPTERLALHVHGCFWHGCACPRGHLPATRRAFWMAKIARNRKRDAANRRALCRAGYRTMQLWQHELTGDGWLRRLRNRLSA